MKNVLVYIRKSTFVEKDIKILKATEYQFKNPFHQFLYFLFHRFDGYFIWFCDYHALIPILFSKLYGKKSYIFVGGYDCYGHKEVGIKYGVFTSLWRGFIAKLCYMMCTKIFPVDDSLSKELVHYCPNILKKSYTIPTGYDLRFWKRIMVPNRYDFITVALIDNETTYWRKGIDIFINLAKRTPDKLFLIVGATYKFDHPSNVMVLPPKTSHGLRRVFSQSTYYCQFSRIEGLPNVLIEAMLCNCTPYVAHFGNIIDLIHGTPMGRIVGYVYPYEQVGWHPNHLTPAREAVKHLTITRRKNEILSNI